MTPEQYNLAKRRAWCERHCHETGLTDREVENYRPFLSANFAEGFDEGYKTGHSEGFADGGNYAISHQWISVENHLPEDGRLVLAHFSDAEDGIDYATAYRQDGQWQPVDGFYYDCIVDYWMPIPELNPEKP